MQTITNTRNITVQKTQPRQQFLRLSHTPKRAITFNSPKQHSRLDKRPDVRQAREGAAEVLWLGLAGKGRVKGRENGTGGVGLAGCGCGRLHPSCVSLRREMWISHLQRPSVSHSCKQKRKSSGPPRSPFIPHIRLSY